jgi:apolipoprotein N-acyltransferase
VPFGEYLPFQSTMERIGLVQLTKVQGGFIPGTGGGRSTCRTRRACCR